MLKERPGYVVVPISLEHDLNNYLIYGIRALIQKVTYQLDPAKPQADIEADQKRIDAFVESSGLEILDDIKYVAHITKRTVFVDTTNEFIASQSEKVRNKFKMPPSVEFQNDAQSSIESRIEQYEQKAGAVNLVYPVLIKTKTGNKATYAHTFFCVNN